MSDETIPFGMTGSVALWDPVTRVLLLGHACLEVAPGVAVEALVPRQSVTVSGTRAQYTAGPWVVTEIQVHGRRIGGDS